MPFRLTNAPTTFQCLMLSCLGNLHLQYCIIYLGDIIIFSKTPEEHLDRPRAVFEQLNKAELKLKPSKCKFFKQDLIYLGHIISKNAIQTDSKRYRQSRNGPSQLMLQKCIPFLGLLITTVDSSRNMHR